MARKKSATKKARELAEKSGEVEIAAPATKKVESKEPEIKKPQLKDVNLYEDSEEDEQSESSEDEDDYGELITEDVEEGINKVLSAIKTGDKSLFDSNVRFFNNEENEDSKNKEKKSKPIYLKDYHRMNLLDGNAFEDEDGQERDWKDGDKPYAVEQKETKEALLAEINAAFGEEGEDHSNKDEDGDFLKKKTKSSTNDEEDLELPDPTKDGEEFLQAYLDKHAWIGKQDKDDGIEEDDEEFDEAAEKFENAYNFRYEDSNAAEIISYARTQATMRRDKTNSRKRQRQREGEEKQQEEKAKEELLKKKKQKKVNLVVERLKQIKEAVGDEVSDETISKVFGDSLLNDDFDDADWDAKMAQIFDEQYYDAGDAKPEWDEDDEIMSEFKKGGDASEEEEAEEGDDDEEVLAEEDETEKAEEVKEEEKKSKRSKKKEEKYSKKKEKDSLKEAAESIVKANVLQLKEEVEEERGRSKEKEIAFKYRDVSPESFGLTTREILLADDTELNEFMGIKKFAPYRTDESKLKDKRKYAKKRRLKEWRQKVFHNENGPQVEEGEDENVIKIPSIVNNSSKKSHKHKDKKRKLK